MKLSISGINPGIICHENKFAALALKIKHPRNKYTLLFFPLVALKDFLLALEHRLAQQANAPENAKEEKRKHIDSASKKMLRHIPTLEEDELQLANAQRCVNTVVLHENTDSELIFTLILQNKEQLELSIHEYQIELLVTSLIHAMNNAGMRELALHLSSLLDFLPLYDVDCQPEGKMVYDTYTQPEWKKTLFDHYLILLYHYIDAQKKSQTCGAVIKTRSLPDTPETQAIAKRLLTFSPRLKKIATQACQVHIKAIRVTEDEPLNLDKCMFTLQQMRQQIMSGNRGKKPL